MGKKKVVRQRAFLEEDKPKNSQLLESISIDEVFEKFLKAKKAEGLRPRTIKDHEKHYRYFKAYLQEYQEDCESVEDLTAEIIQDYTIYMQQEHTLYRGHPQHEKYNKENKGLKPGSINIRLRTLKCFLRFLEKGKLVTEKPSEAVKLQRADGKRVVLSTGEITLLLAQPNQRSYAGFRDHVMIHTLIDTGLRINELCNLTKPIVDIQARFIHVPASLSKTHMSRFVPFSEKTAKLLTELLKENHAVFPNENHIFLTATGKPMNDNQFYCRLQEYKQSAGLTKQVSAHVMRHTFATHYITNGGEVLSLQNILGHTNTATTSIYVNLNKEDLKKQHAKFSPLSG